MKAPTLRRAQPWLGTMVEIAIVDAGTHSRRAQQAAIDEAFERVGEVHRAMSPQLAESDLARFNRPGTRRITCHVHTLRVLRLARRLGQESAGAFDVTQGQGGAAAWRLEGDQLIKLDAAAKLDLGGIAKGYAVDAAVAALQETGVRAGCVNAGGDLRAFGADYAHAVHLRCPVNPEITRPLVAIAEGALATSLLPRADDAAPAHVSVAAPSCMLADALTKVVAFADAAVCKNLLNKHSATAWRHANVSAPE